MGTRVRWLLRLFRWSPGQILLRLIGLRLSRQQELKGTGNDRKRRVQEVKGSALTDSDDRNCDCRNGRSQVTAGFRK